MRGKHALAHQKRKRKGAEIAGEFTTKSTKKHEG